MAQPDSARSDPQQRWLGAPLIVHQCPSCKRLFDSPSICMDDGATTTAMVRTIKIVLWKERGPGEPMGVGYADEDTDVVIAVDFDTGKATVFPVIEGSATEGAWSISGPARTDGLEFVVIVEKDSHA